MRGLGGSDVVIIMNGKEGEGRKMIVDMCIFVHVRLRGKNYELC